jgi:hypothetical protein
VNEGHYSVVGYMPDPARQETLNIGVLAWSPRGYRLQLDPEAIARVVRENPKLERDALLYVEAMLDQRLDSAVASPEQDIPRLIESQRGFPVSFSEARYTAIPEVGADPLGATVTDLVNRVVRPRRRHSGRGATAADQLERELRPLVRQRTVTANHIFKATNTGRSRRVDFYANSGTNIAIDVVRLAVQKADEISLRADAEAFKVFDIRGANSEIRYLVLCDFATDEDLQVTNGTAKRVIEWAGAEVLTSPGAVLSRLVGNRR